MKKQVKIDKNSKVEMVNYYVVYIVDLIVVKKKRYMRDNKNYILHNS